MHFAVWSGKLAELSAAAGTGSGASVTGFVAVGPTSNASQSCKDAPRRFSKIHQGRLFQRGHRIQCALPRTSGIASNQELDSRRHSESRDLLSRQGKRTGARPALMETGDAVK